jgi:uncharacterized membrane protein
MGDLYLVLLTILFTLIGSLAAIQLKIASTTVNLIKILYNPSLYFGATLYIISALLNIIVLTYWDYSVVLPLTSITYVWTAILARGMFKERLSMLKLTGLVLIILGSSIII